MLSKNELKYIQSLCQKKQRQTEGLFIAEGTKLVEELLKSSYKIKKLYATGEWVLQHTGLAIAIETVTDIELQKISQLQTPNQVLAVVEHPVAAALPGKDHSFILAVDGIQDPGNLGTIIRIADWFGITQLVASEDTVELYNPKVIQATMGSFTRVNMYYGSLVTFLQNNTLPVFGALLNGKSIYAQPPVTKAVLVIGNEAKGIREPVLSMIAYPVTIPRIGGAESLNAAVATGIIVSHLKTT